MNKSRKLKWPQINDRPYFRSFPNGLNGMGTQLREVFAITVFLVMQVMFM